NPAYYLKRPSIFSCSALLYALEGLGHVQFLVLHGGVVLLPTLRQAAHRPVKWLTSGLSRRLPATYHLEGEPAYRGGIAHHHAQRYPLKCVLVLENRCAATYLLPLRCVVAELHPSGHEQTLI